MGVIKEKHNKEAEGLHKYNSTQILDLMINEDMKINEVISSQRAVIANVISKKIKNGGRLIYIGAGLQVD